MEASSSSKVTVEYHDPSGVFSLVSRNIASRLPLRNLNWQSRSRPLRQIRQLHVDFVPDKSTQTALRPPLQRVDSNGPNSFDIVGSGRDIFRDGGKERRHQIPGLKTSPYLKIYVVRCDDKDTYKETVRKEIREWLREEATSDGKREDHDAFEWLIVHVVVPDTVAASEPRWRETTDELKERRKSTAKWPGKSTKTVFDRLRADFNEGGKTAQDRVAQIRLLKSEVQPDLLPTPAVATTLEETPQERENSWKDIMDKFKTLILIPFDARVRQYEADIAAQESRRTLPGWNFCTFFIHKEGLAKALESIGLVEDALAIYDELSLGLEAVVRDLAAGRADGTATSFAAFTDDIRDRILSRSHIAPNGAGTGGRPSSLDLKAGLFGKDYREKIVRSDISVFDFICYLFTRQKALILRLANTRASRVELGSDGAKDGGEDLVLISEVCWRGSSFIHNAARALRSDLLNEPEPMARRDVDNLVHSWIYAVADQILAETSTPLLDLVSDPERKKSPVNGAPSPSRRDFSFGLGADPYPQRSSSLMIRNSAPELQRVPSSKIKAEKVRSPPSSSGADTETQAPSVAGIPGLPELATYRAELFMMQRGIVEAVVAERGWHLGLRHRSRPSEPLRDVSLDDKADTTNGPVENGDALAPLGPSISLSCNLSTMLANKKGFAAAYEALSDQAMRLYAQATQSKSVETIVADLAMIRYQQGDLDTAAEYFKNILPTFAADEWSVTEAELLSTYVRCLKALDRQDEYLSMGLDMLSKICDRKRAAVSSSAHLIQHTFNYSDDDVFSADGLFANLIAASTRIAKERTLPLHRYFGSVDLVGDVLHHAGKDGFTVRLSFRHLLEEEVTIDQIKVKLTAVDHPDHEIWLVESGPIAVHTGVMSLDLRSSITCLGIFLLEKVTFKAGNLLFEHDFKPLAEDKPPIISTDDDRPPVRPSIPAQPFILCYPDQDAFYAEMSGSKDISIGKPRRLFLTLSSGGNEVDSVVLRLRPLSAGLRLHLADAECEGIDRLERHIMGKGQIILGPLASDSSAVVSIPYSMEHAAEEITVRFEACYKTATGSATFLATTKIPHELPVDVDVNDFFQPDSLFSNFTMRSTDGMPLFLSSVRLQDSPAYAVESPPLYGMPMLISETQPADVMYKIVPKQSDAPPTTQRQAALAMRLEYQPVDLLISTAIKMRFTMDLQASAFAAWSRLLLPHLTAKCKALSLAGSINAAAIFGEWTLPSFERFGWQDLVLVLPPALRHDLTAWLRQWHAENSVVALDDREAREASTRKIAISVDVPLIDVVHSVSMSLAPPSSLGNALTIGEPVNAVLNIRHSEAWSRRRVLAEAKSTSKTTPLSFVYEVNAEPGIWLIGGQRRGHFTAEHDGFLAVDLTLIPLEPDSHSLPTVEIQVDTDEHGEEGKVARAGNTVSSETYHESAGRLVEVTRGTHVVDVWIPDHLENIRDSTAPGDSIGKASTSSRAPTANTVASEPEWPM